MSDFRDRSKTALRNLSLAAEWMMRRNVADDHFWRSTVLTDQNYTDPDKHRPVFDASTANDVFDELIKRGLLVERKVDTTGVPAYIMNYDLDGWDKAVSDGRWWRGQWLWIKRDWKRTGLILVFGCVITTVENRVVGVLDRWIDKLVLFNAEPEPKDTQKIAQDPRPQGYQAETNKVVSPTCGSTGN